MAWWPWISDPKRRAAVREFCLYLALILLMPLFQIGLEQIIAWLG